MQARHGRQIVGRDRRARMTAVGEQVPCRLRGVGRATHTSAARNASETEPMNKSDATRLVTRRIAVLVFPSFPMMAFSAVIEPLRAANVISARALRLDHRGTGRQAGCRFNGIAVAPHFSVSNAPTADYIVVCSGGDGDRLSAKKPLSWIRKSLRLGAHIGSVADGAFYLARAGLLDDYVCTLHWQSQPAFVEAFPHISWCAASSHRPERVHVRGRRRRLRHDA